ncbi:MAG: AGE family epimerase/isomerase, partial [Eubacterium sp.]|nr:AGE family epimerase/isomerase [Eubacterium sp.]
ENNVIAEKTMNTLLHIMEAYTELYRESKNADVLNRLKWTLSEMKDKVYIPERHRIGVFFDADMNSILDLHSYGHDIEATWLIDRALDVIGDDKLKSDFRPMLMDITEEIREKALVDDWLLPECEKGVNLKKRIWWVQCEAVLGFYNAYQKCGNSLYLEISEKIWRQIGTFFIDERIGSEWYNELFEDGTPDESMPIVSEWKCPYHNGRMCLELIERIGSAANLKNK